MQNIVSKKVHSNRLQLKQKHTNLNTKTIENKQFIHNLKGFPQTLSVCFLPNSSISVFLFLSKVSVLVHFQESMRWLFPIQTFVSLVIHFLLTGPDKKPKQTSSKTKWLVLHCLLYFLAFHWFRPAVLFFLNWQFAYL